VSRLRCLAILLLPAAATATAGTPDAAAGAALYEAHCARCHGANMVNDGRSFDLRTFPKDGHDRFLRAVTQGARLMPPFGKRLTPDEIEALWRFVSGS